jgi:hypothetical protein
MLIFGMVELVGDPHLACSAWTAVSEMASAAGVVSSARLVCCAADRAEGVGTLGTSGTWLGKTSGK